MLLPVLLLALVICGALIFGVALSVTRRKRLGNAEHHDLRRHNFSTAGEWRRGVIFQHKELAALAGEIKDHVKPLACGGPDAPSNMQWQTKADAKAKDKWETKGCAR